MPDETADRCGNIEPIEIQEEMERSFLDYAMSVITSRALPDARDGLKPVQRRILYGMYAEGMRPDRPHRKCANAVGEVMGKYHPHGDQSIYDALARMAQDFSLRYPLIDGHGNFGSPNDRPAAAALHRGAPVATRDGAARRDRRGHRRFRRHLRRPQPRAARRAGPLPEPVGQRRRRHRGRHGHQHPAAQPERGHRRHAPPDRQPRRDRRRPHAVRHRARLPDRRDRSSAGPASPSTTARAGARSACARPPRSKKTPRAAQRILVSELPYQTSVETIAAKIKRARQRPPHRGHPRRHDDLSAGDTVGLVIELKRDANAQVVLNQLYKHTPMQTNFAANMVALVDGVPRVLNLRQALEVYVAHQVEVITRRSEYRLNKARDRAHILEGLLKALDMIDAIITLIRGSESADAARQALQLAPYEFSEVQATHILDMALRRLAALERQKLRDEFDELGADDRRARGDPRRRGEVARRHQGRAHRDPRQVRRRPAHEITTDPGDLADLDLIEDEELVLDAVAPRLRQDGVGRPVPHPGPRRQGRARRQPARGGLGRAPPHAPPRTRICCSSRTAVVCTDCARTRSR